MNEIFEEMNNYINNFYEEANMIIINDYRNKIKSGEWNFYIVPDKVGFIYMLEKADYSDYKILNSKLIEEYGI